MSDGSDSTIASFLKDHPRLMGALFTLVVLLTQVSPALAKGATTGGNGP